MAPGSQACADDVDYEVPDIGKGLYPGEVEYCSKENADNEIHRETEQYEHIPVHFEHFPLEIVCKCPSHSKDTPSGRPRSGCK